jgi:hypothetical protein
LVLMIAEMSEAYRLNRGRDWRVKAVPQFEIGAGPGQNATMIGPPDGAWLPLHRGRFALPSWKRHRVSGILGHGKWSGCPRNN